MSACGSAHQWNHGLAWLDTLQQQKLKPDNIALKACIYGCSFADQWEAALSVMELARKCPGRPPEVELWNCFYNAFYKGGRWELLCSLIETMRQAALARQESIATQPSHEVAKKC
eukprot:428314-Amphidinium_carterae.1